MKGFTLLELLIVIVIIGILSAIALPSYKAYAERARFSEIILAATPYKTAVSLALFEGENKNTLNDGSYSIPAAAMPTKNLANLTVAQGVITATATSAAGGYTYVLTPDENGEHWSISGTCLAAHYCKG